MWVRVLHIVCGHFQHRRTSWRKLTDQKPAMLLAAASVSTLSPRVGGQPGSTPGHPSPKTLTVACPASQDEPGSRVTWRGWGRWGRRASRPRRWGSRGAREVVWVGAGRSRREQRREAVAAAEVAKGRPCVRVTWCEAGSHLATNTNREERPPRERQRPFPCRPRRLRPATRPQPAARQLPPTPCDRSLAPPASRVFLLLKLGATFPLLFATRTERQRSAVESTKEGRLCHSLARWEELWRVLELMGTVDALRSSLFPNQ